MTGCPAYLCITVTEWPRGRLIIRQDVLVSCPPHFDLTFHVPRTSTVRQSNVPSPNSGAFQPPAPETVDNDREVVYECVLDDAKVVHRISLLVSLTSTSSSASRTTFDDYGQFPSAQNETETYRDDSLVTSVDDVHAQTAFIVVALATTVMSLRLCACGSFSDSSGSYFPLPVALLSQSKHSNGGRKSNDQRQPSLNVPTAPRRREFPLETGSRRAPTSLSIAAGLRFRSGSGSRRRIIVVMYVAWKLLYSVGVTLTVLSTVARIAIRRQYYTRFDDVTETENRCRCLNSCRSQLSMAERFSSILETDLAYEVSMVMYTVLL